MKTWLQSRFSAPIIKQTARFLRIRKKMGAPIEGVGTRKQALTLARVEKEAQPLGKALSVGSAKI